MESGLSTLIFLGLLIGVFYFMLIRPQKKRVESHRNLIESLEIGDEVVTIGGMYATVRSIGDEDIEIEPSPGTTLRFLKSAIARRLVEDEDDDYGDTGDDSEG